eukprot:1588029-Ditylum_brightwellii.AAC.1
MTKAALKKILTEMCYEDNRKKAEKEAVGTLCQMKMVTKELLKKGNALSPGIIDEPMVLQEWYIEWSSNKEASAQTIKETFIEQLLDEYVMKRSEKMKESKEELSKMKLELEESRIKFEESDEL